MYYTGISKVAVLYIMIILFQIFFVKALDIIGCYSISMKMHKSPCRKRERFS